MKYYEDIFTFIELLFLMLSLSHCLKEADALSFLMIIKAC